MGLEWHKISEEPYRSGYRKLLRRQFEMPDGRIEESDLYNDGDTVAGLALTPERQVITAKHFRPGPEKVLNELIGGFCDPNEQPIDAMCRELMEETGYAGKATLISSCYFSAYGTGQKHIFLIENCVRKKQPQLDQAEYLKIELLPIEEFKKRCLAGQTTDLDAALLALHHIRYL